mgnify:CR=1 FL=1
MNEITKSSYLEDIIDVIKNIDETNLSDDISNSPVTKVIEEQKIYFWIRVYLKDENPNIEIGDDISIKYIPSGEELDTKFICYAKKGLLTDHLGEITNYNAEDDKKILCLMVDSKKVNFGDDIPFIRTLFKSSYHYDYQLVRRDELIFTNKRNDIILDYYDVDF